MEQREKQEIIINSNLIWNIFRMKTEKIISIYQYILEKFDYSVYVPKDGKDYLVAFPKNDDCKILICSHIDTVRDRIDLSYKNYYYYHQEDFYFINNERIENISNEDQDTEEIKYIYDNLDRIIIDDNKYFDTDIYLLIDTDTDNIIRCIKKNGNKTYKSEILGGDDRTGLYIITHILYYTNIRPIIALFNGEESGCIGSRKCSQNSFITKLIKEKANFLIQFDRREIISINENSNKLLKPNGNYVNYISNTLSPYIKEKMLSLGYELLGGSISDVKLLSESTKLQHINISSGFVNEHTSNEQIILYALKRSINTAIELLTDPVLNNNKFIMQKSKSNNKYTTTTWNNPIENYKDEVINLNDEEQVKKFINNNINNFEINI
jgi:hypothetical protein